MAEAVGAARTRWLTYSIPMTPVNIANARNFLPYGLDAHLKRILEGLDADDANRVGIIQRVMSTQVFVEELLGRGSPTVLDYIMLSYEHIAEAGRNLIWDLLYQYTTSSRFDSLPATAKKEISRMMYEGILPQRGAPWDELRAQVDAGTYSTWRSAQDLQARALTDRLFSAYAGL